MGCCFKKKLKKSLNMFSALSNWIVWADGLPVPFRAEQAWGFVSLGMCPFTCAGSRLWPASSALLFLQCARKGKSCITPQLMFVPNWWDNPSEANVNFESTGLAASCCLFGFCGPEQEATVPDVPASLTGTWAAQKQSQTTEVHHLNISSERCLG